MPTETAQPVQPPLFSRGRQRAFVKVQDGCRYRCTFCIVTVARGPERSRPIKDVVEEINVLSAQGVQEVVLTGVHVGGYGRELGTNLSSLIEGILHNTDVPRLRLASIEPWDLADDFFDLFHNERLMPHMHLPLQSGADSVLKRMARRCRSADFAALVKRARQQIQDFNVTTDLIVGFPGETDDEWQETLRCIKRIGFGDLHVFPYSARPGTKAAVFPDQIPIQVKKARSEELRRLGQQMKKTMLKRYVDRTYKVLWEGQAEPQSDGKWRYWGYTPNYLRVAMDVPAGQSYENKISLVHGDSLDGSGNYIRCRPIE